MLRVQMLHMNIYENLYNVQRRNAWRQVFFLNAHNKVPIISPLAPFRSEGRLIGTVGASGRMGCSGW